MDNLNEVEKGSNMEIFDIESSDFGQNTQDAITQKMEFQTIENSTKSIFESIDETPQNLVDESRFKKVSNSDGCMAALSEVLEGSKNYQEGDERGTDNQSVEVEIDNMSETLSEKMAQLDSLLKTGHAGNNTLNSCEGKEGSMNHVKKISSMLEAFTDSSLSSSSEPQSSAAPFESSSSSQENNTHINTVDFENSIEPQMIWKERNSISESTMDMKMDADPIPLTVEQSEKVTFPSKDIPVIKTEENAELSAPAETVSSEGVDNTCFLVPEFPPSAMPDQQGAKESGAVVKIKEAVQELATEATPLPVVVTPTPRKRGRPRKQVLPNPSPLVESWGPNAQEFPLLEPPKEEQKRPSRSERRQIKKKKIEDAEPVDENSTKKRKTPQTYQKKKRRSTYVPKKKLPSAKKKHSEVENFQNFEEETRMSASEGPTGFTSKAGATGDESQGSSATEGPTRSNVNKKGRMEVGTDGCKPVTVQQIVEYHWPPASSQGEKPEALMIQEQITEYLGVKSFKRKYPSIKRRPVDMEERNYLQENGFVSENMCDMGLTAVFAADIIEIMYNDFPQKFEEYRKYTREKKAKEQRALREKQAAERADMDPKKEAIESTISWNTDFNKTRRIKMDVPKRKYNSKVLLGNWFEKNCEDEYKMALYVKKKERKNLLVIGVRVLFENFLKPVVLSMRSVGLAYGDTIQILAPDVPSAPAYAQGKSQKGVVLSTTIEANDIENTDCIIDDMYIIGSPLREPCARNTFIIESCDGKKDGENVCYGDTFTLKSACGSQLPLYVDLPVASLGGPVGKSKLPNPQLKLYKGRDAREKRASCFDLQTFTVHFPTNRFKRISLGKPGHYPVALIPGQNTDYYKSYTSNELKYFPLNTVLYGPLRPNERHFPLPNGSDGSQSEIDDSSSSDESSSSSSEETQDTEETNSTAEDEAGASATEVKIDKSADAEEKESVKSGKNAAKTPKGRGRGKANIPEQRTEPKKRLGRPPKLKLASIKLKRLDGDIVEALKEEKLDISSRVIIHTCKMCHEEESKNKNGEFESFIECAQCKGKIHPSCIDLTADMIPKISSYGWQCTDCKSCVKCGQSSSEDKMIFCDQCDRGYHIFCVGLSEVPSGNYICVVCKPNTTSEEPSRAHEENMEVVEIKKETPEVKSEIKVEEETPEALPE